MQCQGVDVFVVHPGRPENLPRKCGPFSLELVSNRGTTFDLDKDPGFMLVDWHRCRYTAGKKVSEVEVLKLLEEVSKNYPWEKAQKLFVSDSGELLYSKAHS